MMYFKVVLAFSLAFCVFQASRLFASATANEDVEFSLQVSSNSVASNEVLVTITVPNRVRHFEAPLWYGGAPLFLNYLKNLKAAANDGTSLPTDIKGNRVTVDPSLNKSETYTLSYTYKVPQTVSGQVDQSIPVLNQTYGRFDNNVTFLSPVEILDRPAHLKVSAPNGWKVRSSWGEQTDIHEKTAKDVVSGMIAMGDYEFSKVMAGTTEVEFALIGDFDHQVLKDQFVRVLNAQQASVGALPSKYLLVAVIPTTIESVKGSSLKNALIVNFPAKTKLDPFNFAAIGTISHELFHQWNVREIFPNSEAGVYLFTEGFTNYFSVAALTKSGLIPESTFGRFLWRYKGFLESNPEYPSDFAKIQSGMSSNENVNELNYQKGPFVAVLLDLALREDTNGSHSVASWFQVLRTKFRGTQGYSVEDLRASVIEYSGKTHGQTQKVFDEAFLGGARLDLESLLKDLGVQCSEKGVCSLTDLPANRNSIRSKLFSATL